MKVLPGFKFLSLVVVVAVSLQTPSTAGWQTVHFHELFSFRLPSDFIKRDSNGDDTRAEYYNGQTKLLVVWRNTEAPQYDDRRQASMHDYQESTTRIGGQRANIRTYWQTVDSKRMYRAELNLGNWARGEVQLYMRLESDEPAMRELADQIFKSVTLPIPSPERP
ncbi:MAG TPA: hypothetical protein VGW58_18735 [Pyrinomonadaceae bacterium]|nr:hypothetical protein [Pyrinomonadaceae bacterium]